MIMCNYMYPGILKNGFDLVRLHSSLQSDTHVAIDFCEIKFFPSIIRKTNICLVGVLK